MNKDLHVLQVLTVSLFLPAALIRAVGGVVLRSKEASRCKVCKSESFKCQCMIRVLEAQAPAGSRDRAPGGG